MPSTHASKQKNRNKDTEMCVRPDMQRRGERVPDKVVVDAGEELLQVADQESTESSKLRCPSEQSFDDDRTVAGPSFPDMMQKGPLLGNLGMCAACRRLYQTAKKKRPLKNKLLHNDPTSLTCDHWVMQKRRSTRRRGHGMELTPWDHHVIECVRERFERPTDEGDQRTASTSHCPRKHVFLQRNLKRCRVDERARKTVRKQAANDGSLTEQPRVDDSVHGDPVPHRRSSTERKSRRKHVARDRSSNKPRVVDSGLHSDTSLHGDPVPHRGASRTGRKSRRTQSGSAQDGTLAKQPCLVDSGLHSDTSFCSDPVPQSRSGTTRKSRKKQQSAKDGSASKPRVGDSGLHSNPSFHGDPVHTTGSRTAKKGKKNKSGAAQNLAKQPRVDDSGLHSDASVHGDPVHTTGSRTAKKGKKNKSGAAQDLAKQPRVDDSGLHSDASFRGDLAKQPHVDDRDLHSDPVHTTGSRTAKKGKKKKSGAAQDLTKQPRVDDSGLHSDTSFRGDPVPHRGSSTERRRQSAKDGTLAKQPCLDPMGIVSQPECSETESSTSGGYLCFELIPASVTYAGPVPVARSPPKRRRIKAPAGDRFKELFHKALCKRSTIERLDCM